MRRFLLPAAVAVLGCGEAEPRDQWIVHLATDAPIPQLGDRLLVEVLVASGEALVPCAKCQHQHLADPEGRWPVSFGIAARQEAAETWIRARLYRSSEVDELALPRPELAIDLLARLPPAQGVTDVVAILAADCIGRPADVEGRSACDPSSHDVDEAITLPLLDHATLPWPNSWPPAERRACHGDAPDPGMRCVPGGLLILGSSVFLPPSSLDLAPLPERLVRVSPFWMDVDEMTVGQLKLHVEGMELPDELCSYDSSTENDALPMNCVTHELAEAACKSQGKELPTEAQWEHAASNAGRETAFPFDVKLVSSDTLCDYAVVATQGACVALGPGPKAGGNDADVNDFGIRNLAGNVSEWARDRFVPYADAACWGTGPALLEDPVCEGGTPNRVVRGGNWATVGALARAAARDGASPDTALPHIGFRCVAPDQP